MPGLGASEWMDIYGDMDLGVVHEDSKEQSTMNISKSKD